jgi:hypothetical protein
MACPNAAVKFLSILTTTASLALLVQLLLHLQSITAWHPQRPKATLLCVVLVRIAIFIPVFAILLWQRSPSWTFFVATFVLSFSTWWVCAIRVDGSAWLSAHTRSQCSCSHLPFTIASIVLHTFFPSHTGMRPRCLPWHAKATTLRTHTR